MASTAGPKSGAVVAQFERRQSRVARLTMLILMGLNIETASRFLSDDR